MPDEPISMSTPHRAATTAPPLLQLAQLAVDAGAGSALTQLLKDSPGPCRLHAAVTLGYLAAHSPVLALALIAAQVRGRLFPVRIPAPTAE